MKIIPTFIIAFFICLNTSFAQVTPDHTVIVVLENKAYNQIVGNTMTPYINSLISNSHAALFTQSFGLTHPSQPNYIMLYSGSAQGVTDNGIPPVLPFTTLNLGAGIIDKGLTFTGYSEGLPSVGSNAGGSGSYARKHNPWVNWQGTGVNGIPPASNRPYSDFPTDFNLLPSLSFVIPNQANDMHDGTIAEGDAWLQANLDPYIQWCINNNSLFILTFDEDDRSSSNQILTLFIGADIKGGSYDQRITHYNVLRTLEEVYQLPYAGESADSSAIKGIWLSLLPVIYMFTGDGNWDDPGNWANNLVPPVIINDGSEIIIDPVPSGECILNIPYTVPAGVTLKVMPGKKLALNGNLIIN